MKAYKLFTWTSGIFLIILMSCNTVTLKEQEAQNLVSQTLNLPKSISIAIGSSSFTEQDKMHYYYALLNQGFLYPAENSFWAPKLEVNADKSAPYYIGKDGNEFVFKKFDIGLGSIQSISIDKEEKIARVAFTLKYINIPPYTQEAEAKSKNYTHINLNNSVLGELEFKKFDKGWQLKDNSKTSEELLLFEILKNKY